MGITLGDAKRLVVLVALLELYFFYNITQSQWSIDPCIVANSAAFDGNNSGGVWDDEFRAQVPRELFRMPMRFLLGLNMV